MMTRTNNSRILLVLLTAAAALLGCSTVQQGTRQIDPTPAGRHSVTATPGDSSAPPYIPPWSFMSLSTAAVDTFLLEHPTYDGRGVVILVFDTGVDMSIAGLQRTSTGLPKVIDAIDFTRSNVVRFRPATVEANSPVSASASNLPVRLRDLARITPQPVDGNWYIGFMDERLYRNSTVRDFDGDGVSRSKFGALLYRAADGWRVVLDTDADSSMADETPVGTYSERLESFQFRQTRSDQKSPLTMTAWIDTAAKEVVFHYDMNVHGTHVAGISAGFGINGEPGFNGVAPGAQVVPLR